MASSYTRQSAGTIITGAVILASGLNNEFNQLVSAFDATTGHDHSGGVGLGPKLSLTGAASISGILPPANGGTGVANNAASTITITGAYALAATLTNTTAITFPTTGTLATLAGSETFTNKTLTSPILTTPQLGTPASGVLTSCTGYVEANLVTTDVTTNNVTSTKHGFAPKPAAADATKYLNGGATPSYTVPAGTLIKRTLYGSGSGTWTPDAKCVSLILEMWGAGGGTTGTGGSTTFASLTATGGINAGGTGAGGTSSGGDLNVPGTPGAMSSAANLHGFGGAAYLGPAGALATTNGLQPGAGAGPAGNSTIGGGGGAYIWVYATNPGAVSYSVGAGGTGTYTGGAGLIRILEFS